MLFLMIQKRMKQLDDIIILLGGLSAERAISLKSGEAVAESLMKDYSVKCCILDSEELPSWINSGRHIVFPLLHGAFGEDGGLQTLLERANIEFVGSGSVASALCMDKYASKLKARELGLSVVEACLINAEGNSIPIADELINELGDDLVLKPSGSGSSDGLSFISNRSSLGLALSKIESGHWLLERRIHGREFTVGVLGGSALEVVEIECDGGRFDFSAKYESNQTKYYCPARIDKALEHKLKDQAEAVFRAFDCRDFARIDFMVEEERVYFLEINTIPGMTEKSLLPKSAAAKGITYDSLCKEMVSFAFKRFQEAPIC